MNLIIIARITVAATCLPIIIAALKRKDLNKPLRIFLMYCVLSLVVNVSEQFFLWYASKNYASLEVYFKYFDIQDTSFIGILYYVLDFIFLGWFYTLLLGKNHQGRIVLWISYLLLLVCVLNYLFIEGYKVYGKFNPAADAIFIFVLAAYYLFFLFKSNLSLPLYKNPYAWISLGLMIPHIIGIFLFIVGDVVHKENYYLFTTLSSLKNGFLIIGQILMAIGFYRAPYTRFITLPDEK